MKADFFLFLQQGMASAMRTFCLVLIFSWVTLFPPLLFARSSNKRKLHKVKSMARSLFYKGRKLARKKQYTRAIQLYQRAIEALKNAEKLCRSKRQRRSLQQSQSSFLYIIAKTYELDKLPFRAYREFEKVLLLPARSDVLRKARASLRRLLPFIRVTINIMTQPEGANIALQNKDGKGRLGQTPVFWHVKPGRYTILLAKPGFQTLKWKVQLAPRAQYRKNFFLQKTSLTTKPLPKPPSRRQPTKPSRTKQTRLSSLSMGAQKASWQGVTGWSFFSAASISLLAGGGFLGKAFTDFNKVNNLRGKLEHRERSLELHETLKGGKSLQNTGLFLVGVGAGMGLCSLLFFALQRKQKPQISGNQSSLPRRSLNYQAKQYAVKLLSFD